jgi:hypothetical protein
MKTTNSSWPETMADASRRTFPIYVFKRAHEIETPNRILAGQLHLNNFGQPRLSHRARRELAEIIRNLTADAQAGRLPDDALVVGWPRHGRKPENAADVTDAAVMSSWTARAFTVAVRVDAHGNQTVTRERDNPMRT